MTALSFIWILFIACGALGTAATWLTFRGLREQVESAGGKEGLEINNEISSVDKAIERSSAHLEKMLSMDELQTISAQHKKVSDELNGEREQIKNFEARLENSQTIVQGQEKRHNELKRGKEEAERLAIELQANMEDLASESVKLQGELQSSKTKMSTLANETTLTEEQKAALQEIQDSLSSVLQQLMDLKQVSDQATERFLGLQTQYDELEQEYRRLVDKELEG